MHLEVQGLRQGQGGLVSNLEALAENSADVAAHIQKLQVGRSGDASEGGRREVQGEVQGQGQDGSFCGKFC